MTQKKRDAVPAPLRDEMLVAVGHRCIRCMSAAPELDLHHITPLANGGQSVSDNLVVLCPTCHRLAHRYGMSRRQLKLYERQAILRRSTVLDYPAAGERQTLADTWVGQEKILTELNTHVRSWYNEFVETQVRARTATSAQEAASIQAEYVFSRKHLPDVIAIRRVLAQDDVFATLTSDINVFLRLLVQVDHAGAYF